jgi:hypothetical protein
MIVLTALLTVLSFPLMVTAFYRLRLGARRRALNAKLLELNLEGEYLKVFHGAEWEALAASGQLQRDQIRAKFTDLFANQFRGDNSWANYRLPFLLTLGTTIVFALYIVQVWAGKPGDVLTHPALFAIAGALIFAYPMFVSKYASLSLNPPTILELNGKIWLSVLIGIVATTVIKDVAAPLVAFLFSLLPIAALEILKKKAFGNEGATESAGDKQAMEDMLAIVKYDRDLMAQLNYIGVRSVLELAYENPIRLFVEADPMLISCIDLVDQANLYLYVPDKDRRQGLNRYGVRTAIDLMTQLYDEFPSRTDPGRKELRDLDPDEPLPAQLEKPLAALANVLGLGSVDEVRNLIAMMVANPQLQYVLFLWQVLGTRVEGGFEEDDEDEMDDALGAEAKASAISEAGALEEAMAAKAKTPGEDAVAVTHDAPGSGREKGQRQDQSHVTGRGEGRGQGEVDVQVQHKSQVDEQRNHHDQGKDAQKGVVPPDAGTISSTNPPPVPVR